MTSILSKKYTNPSSDVITVLAGLDEVDRVISDFVAVLDGIVRNGASREFEREIEDTTSNLMGIQSNYGARQSEWPLL